MKAPENIYFTQTENGTHYYTDGIPFERKYIEYVRKDAFIEKAVGWLEEHLYDYWSQKITDYRNFTDEFKRAMV